MKWCAHLMQKVFYETNVNYSSSKRNSVFNTSNWLGLLSLRMNNWLNKFYGLKTGQLLKWFCTKLNMMEVILLRRGVSERGRD
jgi:hypothetical protein